MEGQNHPELPQCSLKDLVRDGCLWKLPENGMVSLWGGGPLWRVPARIPICIFGCGNFDYGQLHQICFLLLWTLLFIYRCVTPHFFISGSGGLAGNTWQSNILSWVRNHGSRHGFPKRSRPPPLWTKHGPAGRHLTPLAEGAHLPPSQQWANHQIGPILCIATLPKRTVDWFIKSFRCLKFRYDWTL